MIVTHNYRYQTRKRLVIYILFVLVLFFGLFQLRLAKAQVQQINNLNQALAQRDQYIQQLTNDNKKLNIELKVALAQSKNPILPKAGFNILVDLLFPKPAADRYKAIVTQCENSPRDPKKVHLNSDGSIDLGVSQINSYWQSKRVQQIFGEDFYTAMSDSVKNMVYAALIYKDQHNFSAWSCDKKLAEGK
jgi:hypothetical protein